MAKDILSLPIRTYSAQAQAGSLFAHHRRAVREVWQTRGILWGLFLRDFHAQFRQRLLGYCWAVLTPLVNVASFAFLFAAGVLQPGEVGIPYPVYLFIGTGLWFTFIAVYASVSSGLTSHGDLLMRTGIPKLSLALSGLGNVLYGVLIHFATLAVVLAVTGTAPAWQAVFYPVLLLPLFALGIGLGLVFGALGAVARDVTTLSTTMLNLLMYLTPVVYTADALGPGLRSLVGWNPLTYLIDAPRSVLVLGVYADWQGYGLAVGVALLVLLFGVQAFYQVQDQIAERL